MCCNRKQVVNARVEVVALMIVKWYAEEDVVAEV